MSKNRKCTPHRSRRTPPLKSQNTIGRENASRVEGKPQTGPGKRGQPRGNNDDDHAGLDVLYRQLRPDLVRYLRRLLNSSGLAEDITQDAFLILVRKWPDVRNHPSPRAWLFTVARHLAFDTFKERSREFLTEEPPDQALAGGIDQWDSHATQVVVREAVGKLPPRQCEAVWLFYICGFKQDEVAAIMQIQRSTVAALLYQARIRLAELLGA